MGNKVIELTNDAFQNEVLSSKTPVLVDFWAPWCGPCRMIAPIIEEIAKAYTQEELKVAKVNVDENQELATQYKVMSIPTLAIFKDGQIVKRLIGMQSSEALKGEINEVI
ncbi:MAG: thioredoxin [Limnochordia bacterium]|nr:thioredoxin [Limnochordia bacterium]